MSETMLKVDGINVYYGNIHALHDISFTVNKGEIVTLIGANGAGKSTNLKTISGLLRTKTGDIVFKDKSIKTLALTPSPQAPLPPIWSWCTSIFPA